MLSTLPLNLWPGQVIKEYDNDCTKHTPPDLFILVDIIAECCEKYSTVFVLLDGLDECNSSHLEDVFFLVRRLVKQPSLRVLCTSRPHLTSFKAEGFEKTAVLEISAHTTDIENYVSNRLKKEGKFSSGLGTKILDKLITEADGM